MVITGGAHTKKIVSRYDMDGWVRDMPSLNQGRGTHGCAAFMIGGDQVRLMMLYRT